MVGVAVCAGLDIHELTVIEGMGSASDAIMSAPPASPARSRHRGGSGVYPFLAACRRASTDVTPVWLMRQAGRYLPEYRAIRARLGFLELCKTPEAAAEVTCLPVDRLGVDAAILFADILLIAEPLGVGLEFVQGDGPIIRRPVRAGPDVDRLVERPPAETVPFVFETVRRARRALDGRVPLIGFAGGPFTVASYLVEGGASRDYLHTKRLMYADPGAWHALLGLLARTTAAYLAGQIAAGAQAVQLFDSWLGTLAPGDYREFVLPHTRAVIEALAPGVPVIHFGTGTTGLLEAMRAAGGDVIGLDWRVDLGQARARLGPDVAVQGNLDPAALFAPLPEIRRRVAAILRQAGGRPGHVFNLGHGVLPETPVDHVVAMVDAVHELSAGEPGCA
jgi:uroporphyrinogen decarboxylase